MQHLSEKWLKPFNYLYLLYCVVVFSIYAFLAYQQQTLAISPSTQFGASLATGILSIITIIYGTIFLKFFKKHNILFAYLITYVLVSILNALCIEIVSESGIGLTYLVITYLLSIIAVIYGFIVFVAVFATSGVVLAMIIAGTTLPTQLGKEADVFIFIVRLVVGCIIAFTLRNFYKDQNEQNTVNYIERYFVTNEVVKLLTNSIGDGVVIVDNEGIVRSVNPTVERLLGKQSKELLDLNYRSVINLKNTNNTAIDPNQEPVSQALKKMVPVSGEFLLQSNQHPEVYIDLTVSAIIDPEIMNTYGAVIIIRDISDKKKEEGARSEFISTASHEMRTPVASIEGYIELAINPKLGYVDSKAREYLEKARLSAQHLARLFQDLLDSARAEDGRISNHPAVTEIGSLLERQAEASKMIAQQKGLDVEFIVSSEQESLNRKDQKSINPLYFAYVDPDRIREVASNLIDNAIKYTPAGKITLGLTGDKDVVQFFIRDTGIGMNPEDVPHLFQKFYRIESAETATTGGTGLGLFISRKIVALYNGRIWAESEKNKGTTFYVNIPRMNTAQAQATLAMQQNQAQTTTNVAQ